MTRPAALVATSLRDVARGQRVARLLLPQSQDLICKNLMCEHVGSSCACKLALVLERVPELEEMDLSRNQLRFLPDATFALTRLRRLNVAGNLLETLSPGITRLQQLEVLNLAHNRLTDVPVDELLSSLPRLRELDVSGNPLPESARERLRRWKDVQVTMDDS
ncbi:hypothetical protein ATCC90586_001875 [Pythium insidiosum]|nr:hypothetical protein ATCC90586_001875 [Pythium insidiosum]